MVRRHEEENINLHINAIKLSAKFAHIIMPFEINFLQRVLIGLKYTFEGQQIPRGIKIGELGPTIVPITIARREDLEVEYNIEKQILGIGSSDSNRVVNAFTELITTVKKILEPIKLNVLFYEALISATGNGSTNPLQVFASEGNKLRKAAQLNEIFGEKVSPFGIRLCPSNCPIDSSDWFEYRIEPSIFQPERVYSIVFIHRNSDLDKVKKAILKFDNISRKIIADIEK
jgi:hypothetical protein